MVYRVNRALVPPYKAARAIRPAPSAPPTAHGPLDMVGATPVLELVLDVVDCCAVTVTVAGMVEVLFIVAVTSIAWYTI